MIRKLFNKNKLLLKLFSVALLLILITTAITLSLLDKKNNYILSLKQVQHSLVSVSPKSINAKNNLKPVYVTGLIETTDNLRDERLGISTNALSLHRKVYMYQWKEKVASTNEMPLDTEDDSFSYEQVWSDHLSDSSKFHMQHGHVNPKQMPLKSKKIYAQRVTVGDFVLPDITNTGIQFTDKVDLSNLDIKALEERTNKQLSFVGVDDMVCSGNVEKPQIGDICIELYAAKPQIVSIIAQQDENKLRPYLAQAGQRIFIIEPGEQSASELIESAMNHYKETPAVIGLKKIIRTHTGF